MRDYCISTVGVDGARGELPQPLEHVLVRQVGQRGVDAAHLVARIL